MLRAEANIVSVEDLGFDIINNQKRLGLIPLPISQRLEDRSVDTFSMVL